ncbi:unnamed protein product, partial [Mesorhabditis spiculigera]
MVALSAYLIFPFLVADAVCAGNATARLRVDLISATFISGGVATFIQSTFGLRLAILHGASLAFLAPIQTYQVSLGECTAGDDTYVPEEEWHVKLATLSGSLMTACCVFVLIGATGAVGWFARHVGPITIVPLLTLIAISTVPTIEQKLSSHYMAIVELVLLIIFVVFLEDFQVPIPYFSWEKRKKAIARAPVFGQFPYLISLGIAWLICYILSSAAVISDDSPASTKRNETHGLIANAPWVKVPYPGEYGGFRVNTAVCLGFVAAVLSSVIENVASRVTVQLAGVLSVALGLFTKSAAILACIPDPLIGSILCLGMSMIAGVALSNLKVVNLSQTRNLAIMGLALLLGLVIPSHFTKSPIKTGNDTWDEVLNMLLTIQMLIGGLFAFLMDIMVPGASRKDRGLADDDDQEGAEFPLDGFALPDWVDRELVLLVVFVVFLEHVQVPIPYYSLGKRRMAVARTPLFGQFPVASRVTVQLAGVLSVALGLFTKLAAILACIPDPLIGSILCLGMSMIAGVALSNLKVVNLSQTRNLAIMGLALLLGLVVPSHFTKSPIRTGSDTWDEVLNMLLRIQMLIGGLFAFLMDNMVPGASRKDRGLAGEEEEAEFPLDGFALPDWVDSGLDKLPILRRLPFLTLKKSSSSGQNSSLCI